MTAVAAMLVAWPTIWDWTMRFEGTWTNHVITVFAPAAGRPWWRSILGVGMLAGSVASWSAFLAVAWTLFRGISGRWALMICAALWVVYAVGHSGTYLGEGIARGVSEYLAGYSVGARSEVRQIVAQLQRLAGLLAFPLAIRVALTLSDVRARLERGGGGISSSE
jgi:hypothetical protein